MAFPETLQEFWAIFFLARHKKGIPALQLQRDTGIGSYETAWTLLHKLRSTLRPRRQHLLVGLVEIDDTEDEEPRSSSVSPTLTAPPCARTGASPTGPCRAWASATTVGSRASTPRPRARSCPGSTGSSGISRRGSGGPSTA